MARFVILAWLFALLLSSVSAQITTTSPTGVGATDPLNGATPTATVSLTISPTAVSTCDNLTITWSIENDTSDVDVTPMTLYVTNEGVSQTGENVSFDPSPQEGTIGQMPLSRQQFVWFVYLTEPGFYVIRGNATGGTTQPFISQSPSFLLQPGDHSCLPSASTTPSVSQTDSSTPSSSQSDTPAAVSSHSSKTGAIVGGTIAAIAIVGLLLVFWFLMKRRSNRSKGIGGMVAGPKSASGKGHQRWGNLASIDKLQQGEIPVVIPANSPYGDPTYSRTHSRSVGHGLTDEDGGEKGYGKDTFPVDADLLSEMPTLDSNRGSRRYSSDALSAVLRGSGAAPVLTTTTATSRGGDDPFSDAAFFNRGGKRFSALSVPSTARSPSRVSDIVIPTGRPAPSPLPTPTTSTPSSQANTMARNASATASVGRPSRKPVPQYSDDSIELTNTNKSSPTSHSPLTPSGRSNTGLSSSATSRGGYSSSPSDNHWLQDRAPMANRNIGLAGQGEGPVHYLMPDLPPSVN